MILSLVRNAGEFEDGGLKRGRTIGFLRVSTQTFRAAPLTLVRVVLQQNERYGSYLKRPKLLAE